METNLIQYFPVAVMIFLATSIALGIVVSSYIISPRYKSKTKEMPYESGMLPLRDARDRFNIRFCVIAILFVIFDVEAAFIFPWAIFYKKALGIFSPVLLLGEMFLFIFVLLFGLYYAYKRGGLNWE